jgi:hypothetical protein
LIAGIAIAMIITNGHKGTVFSNVLDSSSDPKECILYKAMFVLIKYNSALFPTHAKTTLQLVYVARPVIKIMPDASCAVPTSFVLRLDPHTLRQTHLQRHRLLRC